MKRRADRKIPVFIACILITMLLFGCTNNVAGNKEIETSTVVEIPVTFLINPTTNNKENLDLVTEFNRQYDGRYKVVVEWLTQTPSGYRSKVKLMNAVNKLPAVITDVKFDEEFYQLLVKEDRLVNLWPYMEQDEEWKSSFDKDILKASKEDVDTMYQSPNGNYIYSYAGIFWNRNLLKQAGITQMPSSWEEIFRCFNTLQNKGVTPVSLHVGGSSWVPMLFSTAYMARTSEGEEFLQQQFPQDYDTKPVMEMTNMLKKLYEYSTDDAIEIDFDSASNYFLEEKTAAIANGYWMIENMDPSVLAHTGFTPFPGNSMIASVQLSSWAVTKDHDKEVQEGAVEFLKFRALQNSKASQNYMKDKSQYQVEQDYKDAVRNVKQIVPNYQLKWLPIIQNQVFSEEIPKLVDSFITPSEFIDAMNRGVKMAAEDY